MPSSCIVPGCNTGRRGSSGKFSTFSAPTDTSLRLVWQRNIGRKNFTLKTAHRICEKHFSPDVIIRSTIHKDASDNVIANVPLSNPRLIPNAVPLPFVAATNDDKEIFAARTQAAAAFERVPTNLEIPLNATNRICTTENNPSSCDESPRGTNLREKRGTQGSEGIRVEGSKRKLKTITLFGPTGKSSTRIYPTISVVEDKLVASFHDHDYVKSTRTTLVECSDGAKFANIDGRVSRINIDETKEGGCLPKDLFDRLMKNPSVVEAPEHWYIFSTPSKACIAISEFDAKVSDETLLPVPTKSLLIGPDMRAHYTALGKAISPDEFSFPYNFHSVYEINSTLLDFSRANVCCGIAKFNDVSLVQDTIGFVDCVGNLRHKKCSIIVNHEKQCDCCKNVRKIISQKKSRMKKYKRKNDWASIARAQQAKLKRYEKKIKFYKDYFREIESNVATIRVQSVIEKCNDLNVPGVQRTLVREIIGSANSKSSHGHRYTENWLVLCILMHVRSQSHYQFLKDHSILPLPSVRTIRRYLSTINTDCEFDKQFFEILKKHLENKNLIQRHGLIILDKIVVREDTGASTSLCEEILNSAEEERNSSSVNGKSKYALVLMFQPLDDSSTHPIGVFASYGPIKDSELAKIVSKAISSLENVGAKVHGVVTDGAETNRKMWTEFGVSGNLVNLKNWCTHPVDEDRKIFFFSDTANLFKDIRNRLYEKELRVEHDEPPIKWNHFVALLKHDQKFSPARAKVCPALTPNHLILNNSSKKRVQLATQLFSNSVAKGLEFYKSRDVDELQDCESTISFCRTLNDLFVSLNRKNPTEGLMPGSKDSEVLKTSLQWLNNWENNYKTGRIDADSFLAEDTSEGLRMTLQSTMDICEYLVSRFDFQYVLSGKINQDPLREIIGYNLTSS